MAPTSTALPHEEQKRAAPGVSFPQAGQVIFAAEYIIQCECVAMRLPRRIIREARQNLPGVAWIAAAVPELERAADVIVRGE